MVAEKDKNELEPDPEDISNDETKSISGHGTSQAKYGDQNESDENIGDSFERLKKAIDTNKEEIKRSVGEVTSAALDDEESDMVAPAYLPVYTIKVNQMHIPIIIELVASIFLAWIIYIIAGFQSIIPKENAGEGVFTGVLFIIMGAVSSFLIYYIVKKRGENALKIIMGVSFFFLTFMLLWFFGDNIIYITGVDVETFYLLNNIYFVICGILATILIYRYFGEKMGVIEKNIFVLMEGVLIGVFLAVIMPTWTAVTMLIGFALWDIISVKRGPIKKIFEVINDIDIDAQREYYRQISEENNIMEKDEWMESEIEIGIGDIAFYSMLFAHFFIISGDFLYPIMGGVGVLIGAFLTLRGLMKNRIMPGLPLSIFIGLGLIGLTYLIKLIL
ncbi:MAG: hypothetical protein ACTSU2_06280 [Promethearchaeota archaeon]